MVPVNSEFPLASSIKLLAMQRAVVSCNLCVGQSVSSSSAVSSFSTMTSIFPFLCVLLSVSKSSLMWHWSTGSNDPTSVTHMQVVSCPVGPASVPRWWRRCLLLSPSGAFVASALAATCLTVARYMLRSRAVAFHVASMLLIAHSFYIPFKQHTNHTI